MISFQVLLLSSPSLLFMISFQVLPTSVRSFSTVHDFIPGLVHFCQVLLYCSWFHSRSCPLLSSPSLLFMISFQVLPTSVRSFSTVHDFIPGLVHFCQVLLYCSWFHPRSCPLLSGPSLLFMISSQVLPTSVGSFSTVHDFIPGLAHFCRVLLYCSWFHSRSCPLLSGPSLLFMISFQVLPTSVGSFSTVHDFIPGLAHFCRVLLYCSWFHPRSCPLLSGPSLLFMISSQVLPTSVGSFSTVHDFIPGLAHFCRVLLYCSWFHPRSCPLLSGPSLLFMISSQVLPTSVGSFSTVLLHESIGPPRFLNPGGAHLRAMRGCLVL